jgi:heptosyltransferase-2
MIGARLPNWLGDALVARRALERLAARHAGEGLVAAAPAPLVPLLGELHPGVAWLATERGVAAARVLARAWRARRVRTVYLFPTSLSCQLAALWSGAEERVGFARRPGARREWEAGLLITHRVGRGRRGAVHLEDEYFSLIGEAPPAAAGEPLSLAPGPPGPAGDLPEPFLALAPGALYGPAKRWPAERFAQVARALLARDLARGVAVVGTPGEEAACQAVAAAIGPAARSLAGRTSLPQLARLLARAACVVANDSGAAHLSAAVGAPTVVLFASTDPGWTAPRGRAVRVVSERLRCTPCFRRSCPWRDDAYACQRVLEPSVVAAAAGEIALSRVA